MIKIAIMGFGTIGSGVYEVLEENRQILSQAAGQELEVKYILDLRDFPGTSFEDKVIHDFSVIEQDPEIRIVVETMALRMPWRRHSVLAMQNGIRRQMWKDTIPAEKLRF